MNVGLRIVVVAKEFPYPPDQGGRADVWRRLLAFHFFGCRLALVCWGNDSVKTKPSVEALEAVGAIANIIEILPRPRNVLRDCVRLFKILGGLPSHAADRLVSGDDMRRVLDRVRSFEPDVVFLDSPYGGVFALEMVNHFKVPMFYRAHNIESRYFWGQAKAASSLRDKLAWWLACLHLERFERKMIDSSEIYFDISAEDLSFWKERGVKNGFWLPPLTESEFASVTAGNQAEKLTRELAFLGNLNTPNNVQGIRWLIEKVMPKVWAERPGTILTIAGSSPTSEIRRFFKADVRLQLVEQVSSALVFWESSMVLVNPVRSGSGVNVKTLDMLMTERPIVSTSQGVAGLVPELKRLCEVADSPDLFARKVIECLKFPEIDVSARISARSLFSRKIIESALQIMR